MSWKFVLRAFVLIAPLMFLIGAFITFFVMPHFGPAGPPLLLVAGFLAYLLGKWIWPLDDDP